MTHTSAWIISIGDELTVGATLDTNAQRLSRRLTDAGLRVDGHTTTPDDLAAIAQTIRDAVRTSDLVVCTGGLGPTADDLTRVALAIAAGQSLIEDADALVQIESYFSRLGRAMPEANKLQALRPQDGVCLRNDRGTAPGLHLPARVMGADVFCLPGPPREMTPMLEAYVVPAIATEDGRVVRNRVLRCFGIGESDLAGRLGKLMDRTRNPLVGTTASGAVVSIRIRYEGSPEGADARVEEAAQQAAALASPFVFGEGDTTLAQAVIDLLRTRRERVSTVESCTGGLVGKLLTDVAGSSDAYVGGWVTYTNNMKTSQVGVPEAIFEQSGAVSPECASAMATGALSRSEGDHALAITGIAGPGGGSDDKPVGTVWIALASRDAPVDVRRFQMAGERESVRMWSAMAALGMLRFRLAGEDTVLSREVERRTIS